MYPFELKICQRAVMAIDALHGHDAIIAELNRAGLAVNLAGALAELARLVRDQEDEDDARADYCDLADPLGYSQRRLDELGERDQAEEIERGRPERSYFSEPRRPFDTPA